MSRDSNPEQPDFDARDARRARQLDTWLEGNEQAFDEGDSLMEALFSYRMARNEQTAAEPSRAQSSRMWTHISRNMREVARPSRARIFELYPWRVAAAVAACLLAGGVLFLLLMQAPEATLLAETDTTSITYTAEDGSAITLRPHSQLHRVPVDDDALVRYRIEGEGLFAVAPADNRSVQVQAADGLVTVLGTKFAVSTWRERVEVVLLEGSVRFEHTPSGRGLVMEPGYRALLARGGYFEETELEAPDLALGWLDDELVLEERPLQDVLLELEHHHRIQIDVPDELQNQTLTGRILLEDPQQSLDDLGVVMGGNFERVGDRTYRFRSD